MGIVAWIVLGFFAGLVASVTVSKRGGGMLTDIVLGVIGAVVGGIIASLIGLKGITGLNSYSLLIALGGAISVLVLYYAAKSRRNS